MSLFSALRIRSFALLWTGQTVSRVGDHLYQVALTWWIVEASGSAAAVGTAAALGIVPTLALLLAGGVVVDRLPRIRVMLASDLLRGALVVGVALLARSGKLTIVYVYGASLIFGVVDAFFQPAYTAAVPEIVPAGALPSANALGSAGTQVGRIAGPPLGAALLSLGGTALVFGLDGASFLLSAALILPLARGAARPAPEAGREGVLRAVREGFAVVAASPWLVTSLAVTAVANALLAGAYTVAIPFVVREDLGGGVGLLGLLYAVFPVGYVLGGAWVSRAGKLRRRGVTTYAALGVAGLGIVAVGLPWPLWARALGALGNGAALEVMGVIWTTSLQELVPPDRLGRVASIDALVSLALLPLGFAGASWGCAHLGAPAVCVMGGGGTVILAAAALLRPAVRAFD